MNVVSLSLVLWIVFGAVRVAAVLLLTFRYIPNDRVGIVEKLWSPSGSVDERPHRARTARPAFSRTCCAAAGTS